MVKYSIFQVSKWFLEQDSMTLKRLMKLCYYAQAWCYTLKEFPLIDESFEAWRHGPVCRELWNRFKYIHETGNWMYDVNVSDLSDIEDIIDIDIIELLELVWNTYGDMTGNALEALTHSEPPWQVARCGCSPSSDCANIISLESMREYYSTIYSGDYGEA